MAEDQQVRWYPSYAHAAARQRVLMRDEGICAGIVQRGDGRCRLTYDPPPLPRGLEYQTGMHR